MITAKNKSQDFLTEFTNGVFSGTCDAPVAKGGADAGFTPMALLEAALAGCLNITMRVYAKAHGIALGDVEVSVELKPTEEGHTFEYTTKMPEGLTEDQKKRLHAAMKGCPIHGILSKPVTFVAKDE